jgi:hypothetical protein
MSENQVVPFLGNTQVAMPAHIAANFNEEDNNIADKLSTPQLRFKGKQWSVTMDGEQTVLTRKGEDGDEPVPVVKLIILDMNQHRSRAYYAGAFDPDRNSPPDCASSDGIHPDASIAEPQCTTCATCPMAAKGSKITDTNAAGVACSSFKRLAVTFAHKPDFGPLLLRLPQTSLYDKDNKEQEAKGWYAYDQYMDVLRARGVKNTAAIITKVKFDPSVDISYPKLLFSADNWISAEAVPVVKQVKQDKAEDILKIIGAMPLTDTPAALPAPDKVAEASAKAAAPAAKATPKVSKAQTAKPAAAPVPEIDPDTGDPIVTKGPAQANPAAPSKVPASAPAGKGLNAILGSWDD